MSDVDNPARDLAAEWNDPRASDITRREAARRAVNALPAIADLLDLLAAHRRVAHPSETFCAACFEDWPCPTTTARDRVAAALTGDAS